MKRNTVAPAVLAAVSAVLVFAVPFASRSGETGSAKEDIGAERKKAYSVSEALEDETFHYDSAGRRDPFRSLMILQSKSRRPSINRAPIQRFDLNKARIIGVLLDEETGARAIIRAGGENFVVTTGMIIGKNEGEVIKITLDGIRVVEKFVDFMGRETLKEIKLSAVPDPDELHDELQRIPDPDEIGKKADENL